mmetsp:Transcript_23381/g.47840  ORF Transcript_23381/g.47840 Transcript_23381/m.47840 type:complete len:219 (-) Transcript_23381:304-960(-)
MNNQRGGKRRLKQPASNVTHQCWASSSTGVPCLNRTGRKDGIPYCPTHFQRGDAIVEVVTHDTQPEIFGKLLIAKTKIPKGYKFVYWGNLVRRRQVRAAAFDHMVGFVPNQYSTQQRGLIDPTPHANSFLQFAAMPGPGERVNLTSMHTHFGRCGVDSERTALAGRAYEVTCDIPKGVQIAHNYGAEWLEERGIEKMDVGTKKFPMIRKKKRTKRESP